MNRIAALRDRGSVGWVVFLLFLRVAFFVFSRVLFFLFLAFLFFSRFSARLFLSLIVFFFWVWVLGQASEEVTRVGWVTPALDRLGHGASRWLAASGLRMRTAPAEYYHIMLPDVMLLLFRRCF